MKPGILLVVGFCATNLIATNLIAQSEFHQQNHISGIRGFITGVKQDISGVQAVTIFDVKESKTGKIIKVTLKEKPKSPELFDIQAYLNQYVVINNLAVNQSGKSRIVLNDKSKIGFLKQSPELILAEPE